MPASTKARINSAGEAGVSHVLDIFAREIWRTMVLMGAAKMSDLNADLVRIEA